MLYFNTNRPCEYGCGKNARGYFWVFVFGEFCYFAKTQIALQLTVAFGGDSPECSQVMNDDITVFVLFVTVV